MRRIGDSLQNKNVLITQCNDFMGPALCEAFAHYGANVIADPRPPITNTIVSEIIGDNNIDVLIANLIAPTVTKEIEHTDDVDWNNQFRFMVDPLHKLSKKIVPGMKNKNQGKIVVMSSVVALKDVDVRYPGPGYAAARGAQISWAQAAGKALAKHNIQVNSIAQGFVDNPYFYPEAYKKTESFLDYIGLTPSNRLADASECSSLAVFLASDESNFFVGQCFPIAGGWV